MKANLDDEEVARQSPDTSSDDGFETLYNRYVTEVYSRYLSTTKDNGLRIGSFGHSAAVS